MRRTGSSGQLREGLVEAVEPGVLGLDSGRLAVETFENAEPAACRTLERASPDGRGEDVARDPEEPRSSGSARDVLEASASEPRLRERLRGQIVRHVGVAAARQLEAIHALGVSVVELAERPGVGTSRLDELSVAPHPLEYVVMATSTSLSS